jgi:hypothetical protein
MGNLDKVTTNIDTFGKGRAFQKRKNNIARDYIIVPLAYGSWEILIAVYNIRKIGVS